jgi:hypothetical protein
MTDYICKGHVCTKCELRTIFLYCKFTCFPIDDFVCLGCDPNNTQKYKDTSWRYDDSNGDLAEYVANVKMGIYKE